MGAEVAFDFLGLRRLEWLRAAFRGDASFLCPVGSGFLDFTKRCVMENLILGLIGEDMAFGVFAFSAIVCLGLSFLIVCLIHPLGNKLLLLGILVALTAFVFAATEPSAGTVLPVVMMLIGVALVLTGVVCGVISHFSPPNSRKSDSEPDE